MLEQYVIAIGGSVGSLEPLKQLFNYTPLDNASYVILRHLPIGYESDLKTILQRHSKLAVEEVRAGMPLMSNRVYFAPPSDFVELNDGRFQLVARKQGPNRAIDLFLESLAKSESRRKAIAIVLSGAGFDGINGIKAIKAAGGLVIVQSPDSAEFPVLPQTAIETGCADFVLPPEDIPVIIQGYVHRPLMDNNNSQAAGTPPSL